MLGGEGDQEAEARGDEPRAGRELHRFRNFHTDSPSFFRKINKDITRL